MSADTILGVNPGTRFVSIAILHNGKLTKYQVHSFFGIWSDAKLRKIMSMLTMTGRRYRVTQVAIKVPDVLPTSIGYTQLIGTLNAFCERNGIPRQYYTLSDIKARLSAGDCESLDWMRSIVLLYPELLPEFQKEIRKAQGKDGYYHKLFEAVATAHLRYSVTK